MNFLCCGYAPAMLFLTQSIAHILLSMFLILQVHSFLITNLAIGDFFMGVYLLIIAVVDTYYRGIYSIYDKIWRESFLCKFAGFISTFSSELSVFTLTVITIDRLICIIFPLKVKRLGLKKAFVVMPCVWTLVFFLSASPLLGFDYFSNFYGRSGVCLALHITPDKPKGWEYSVFVFLVLNLVSFLVIFISYLWMFMVARKTTTAVRKSKAKSDKSMAKRMTLIVMSDFLCWVPIILLGFASLSGAHVPPQVMHLNIYKLLMFYFKPTYQMFPNKLRISIIVCKTLIISLLWPYQ